MEMSCTCLICTGVAESEQSVVCQGSRTFFNLKIYDFAIFLDGKQVDFPTLLHFI